MVLGTLRLSVARKENLFDSDRFEFLWVVDFPMFEWVEDEGRFEFMHHPLPRRSKATPDCSKPIRAAPGRAPMTSS